MRTGLLVVDVQPAFASHCSAVAQKVAQRINNTVKPVTIMWVGEGLSDDCEESVRDYLHKHGARPGRLSQANFIEKDFGFFRGWMDQGVARDAILKVGTQMFRQRRYTSEGLDLDALFEGDVPWLPTQDHLAAPAFDACRLLTLDSLETCGGGSEECLAEIELWLQMQGKAFNRLHHSLVY